LRSWLREELMAAAQTFRRRRQDALDFGATLRSSSYYGLDLAAAGFGRVAPQVTGRPAYAPADLLKLYIYGYLNRVRSSRRLEAETHR
jgi:transposase